MSREQRSLLFIHGSYGLAITMSGLFLNLYLWRLTKDLSVNALFILLTSLFGVFSFLAGGYLSKKKDRLISYRIGIALTALFYLFVILSKEKAAAIPIIIGMINGTASGFYWLGYLVLLYDLVEPHSQSAFVGKQTAVYGFVNTLGPMLAGIIISLFDLRGYQIVFIFSFVLFFIGFLISLLLPVDSQKKGSLNIRLLWRLNRRNAVMKPMWLGWIMWGSCEGLLNFFPTLILFMAVSNELTVGILSIVFGLASILSSMWHSKYNGTDRQPYTILFIWIFYFVFGLPIIFTKNIAFIIVFLIANEISKNLISMSYFSFTLRMIGTLPKRAGLRTESMILREIMLNTGRGLSIICFLVLNYFSSAHPIYLLIFVILLQGFLFKIITFKSHPKLYEIKINTKAN